MKTSTSLDERMRAREWFRALTVPPDVFAVVRVDGRSFSRLTERIATKSFDARFHALMVEAASALVATLQARFAVTHSDEISVLLQRDSALFDRSHEKLVSISAARAAGTLSVALGEAVEVDGRLWVGASDDDVLDYFEWRQMDAARCALNDHCYWALRREGRGAREATAMLDGATRAEKNELLHQRGIAFNELAPSARRGTVVRWESYEKEGVDPRTGETVRAVRRRIGADDSPPMKQAYRSYLRALLEMA